MTVALAKDVEEFLQDQVRDGACTDGSQLINDLLRSLREQQERTFEGGAELEAWLLEASGKPVSELTRADFDAIRDRLRKRLEPQAT
jgi:Arc/MetJ-type ribon-helix-helix transcriptional regulator